MPGYSNQPADDAAKPKKRRKNTPLEGAGDTPAPSAAASAGPATEDLAEAVALGEMCERDPAAVRDGLNACLTRPKPVQYGLFADADALAIAPIQENETKGPGRPPGSANKRDEAVVQAIGQVVGDLRVTMAKATNKALLAYLQSSDPKLGQLGASMFANLAPYLYQKRPMAVDVDVTGAASQNFYVVLGGGGQTADGDPAPDLELTPEEFFALDAPTASEDR